MQAIARCIFFASMCVTFYALDLHFCLKQLSKIVKYSRFGSRQKFFYQVLLCQRKLVSNFSVVEHEHEIQHNFWWNIWLALWIFDIKNLVTNKRSPWFVLQRPLVRKPTVYEMCHKAIKSLIISKTINIESSGTIYKWGL